MKRVMILLFAAALLATGCTSKSTVKTPGIDLSNLDTTVACGDDFYDYACGGWMKKNPLKPEYARFGSFDQLRENNREQIRLLFEELGKQKAEPGSIAQKIGDLYNMGLDSVRLNEEGASPIAEELSRIQSLSGKEAISAMIGEMHRTTSAPFFAIYVDADAKNSTMNIAGWYQAGMNMGDRDYYIADDEANSKIRDSYRNYIQKIFTLSGYSAESAAQAAATVLKVETEIAKAAFTREELRDPQAGYNVMTIDELKRQFGGLDWDIYFNTVDLGIGYLTLGEATPALSGGEAQRLKLASEIGKVQDGSIFIFDEPSIGLHPLDVETLLRVFDTLINQKATIIVIEHDLDVIRNSDYIIDMGPEGGQLGGEIIATGTVEEIKQNKNSKIGKYL